ncbi:7 transmembrane receptor (rhodopsin family) domain-containing protein [Ditylenchus destructor]|uniref:7 transmembrane receptor (Rhodopsin family) domain-containing protein n=1 Tax=Ditylenchus destructor TaxID=166010 RepID=A0AAD4MVB6_9BILA|nr:7 transmembrane receptor (rhodopsin family) domain-containing protein [Ditylenchus destructor]
MTGPTYGSDIPATVMDSVIATAFENDSSGLGVGLGLAGVNLLVVCGNVFVLYILISQKSLHTSTNFIVLSLTLSDFLLGIVILPFSILQEYSSSWMFGSTWCKLWLALDVFFSTASIYNLLAISFDRYMAVRQPIKYRYISSAKMTKVTIATVWIIAGILAVVPLVYDHFGLVYTNSIETKGPECTPATSNNWYILFSAFVSFIAPMFLMVWLNFSIFHTVSDSTKLTMLPHSSSTKSHLYTSFDDVNSHGLMRKHQGGGASFNAGIQLKHPAYGILSQSQRSLNHLKKISMVQRDCHSVERGFSRQTSVCSSRKPTMDSVTVTASASTLIAGNPICKSSRVNSLDRADTFSYSIESPQSTEYMYHGMFLNRNPSSLSEAKAKWLARIKAISMEKRQHLVDVESRQSFHSTGSSVQSAPNCGETLQQAGRKTSHQVNPTTCSSPFSPSIIVTSSNNEEEQKVVCNGHVPLAQSNSILDKTVNNVRKNTITSYIRKQSERLPLYPVFPHSFQRSISMRTELKVARTIGIVVAAFCICWLPFCIIYVLQAWQTCPIGTCIPPAFFTTGYWLGYANSAINPLIYAAFSREFRLAFKKVLMERGSSFRSY